MLMCMNNNYCTYLDEVLTAENCILEENCELHKSSFLVIRLFQESLTWCWNHVSAMSKMLHVHPGHVDEDFSFGQKLHLWKYFQCCNTPILWRVTYLFLWRVTYLFLWWVTYLFLWRVTYLFLWRVMHLFLWRVTYLLSKRGRWANLGGLHPRAL